MSAFPPFEKFEEVSRKYFDKGKDVTTWTPTKKQTIMFMTLTIIDNEEIK